MKHFKYFALIVGILVLKQSFSQIETYKHYFVSPLKIETALAGNFGEPRSRHFHTGIDYKTYSDGKHVVSVAEGYVYRVLVSPWGYGMGIYVNHPNGYTSVYGHLSEFTPEIAELVKRVQYEKQSFAIDTILPTDMFKVNKGQTLAYSGNTGFSDGPHLHFELRETNSEHPVNPVNTVYTFKDNTIPEISSVVIYPLSENSRINNQTDKKLINVKKQGKTSYTYNNSINITGVIGIGVSYVDRMDNSHNRYGAESVKLFVGDELVYHSEVNELSFDKQRCKNSTFDYSYFLKDKKHVHKLFIEPNNDLKIFNYSVNDGMFAIEVGESKDIVIEVTDYNGNVSYANLTINGVENTSELCYKPDAILKWDQSYILLEDLCRVEIDSACLFRDVEIPFAKISEYKYSPSYKVGEDDIPLKKDFKISFYVDDEISHLKDKLFVARVQNDKFSYLKPSFNQNYITASASYFGEFYVWVDTTAPKITPKNISEGRNMKNSSYIELTMEDDLSGISDYNMYINDVWVLGDYYPKKKRLRYYFDSKMTTAEEYELKVIVSDQHENTSEYKVNFKY